MLGELRTAGDDAFRGEAFREAYGKKQELDGRGEKVVAGTQYAEKMASTPVRQQGRF